MAKEAYVYSKRGLCAWQKMPMNMAKEAYVYGKIGLCIWQKRPMYIAEEAYVYGKRGLLTVHICHIIIHTYATSSYAAYVCDKRGLLTVAYRNVRQNVFSYYCLPLLRLKGKNIVENEVVGLFCHVHRPLLPYA